jgi:serine/threonine protein kinase
VPLRASFSDRSSLTNPPEWKRIKSATGQCRNNAYRTSPKRVLPWPVRGRIVVVGIGENLHVLRDELREDLDPFTELSGAVHDRFVPVLVCCPIALRSLAPANLMVSSDGLVKILDFGMAKHASPSEERSGMCSTTASLR